MKLILSNTCTILRALFYMSVLICLLYVGILLGEYRTLKEHCLVKTTECNISSVVEKGSFLTIQNSSTSTTVNIKNWLENLGR